MPSADELLMTFNILLIGSRPNLKDGTTLDSKSREVETSHVPSISMFIAKHNTQSKAHPFFPTKFEYDSSAALLPELWSAKRK